MADAKPVKQFTDDDLIQCGICHIDINDPRSLLCLHTYCLKCLREWSKTSSSKDEVVCPICRENTPLPANGVDGLRSNFLVTKLKDRKALSRQLMEKDVRIACTSCEVSDGIEAVARCLECDDFLCSNCVKAHRAVRLTRNHTVLTLVELRSGKVSLVKETREEHCKEHPGQVLWFYCKSCDVPICRDCSVMDHPPASHELEKLGAATAEQRREIEGLVFKCQAVKEMVDESFQHILRRRKVLDSTRMSVNAAIESRGKSMKNNFAAMVDKQVDALKGDVDRMVSSREKISTSHEDDLQLLNSRLNTALELGSKATTDGSDCDIASAYKPLITTLKQLAEIDVPTMEMDSITFIEGSSGVTLPMIGKVEEVKASTAGSNPIRKRNKRSWNATWRLVKIFGNAGRGKLQNALGVAINQDGDVAVADNKAARVYVYGINDGKMKMSIDTNNGPYGLAVYNGEYIVADETHHPSIYDSLGKYVRKIPAESFGNHQIAGIATDRRGNVLVDRSSKLSIHSYADSTLKATLKVPIRPKYIAGTSDDDRIIIRANGISGAQVIDSKGTTIHVLRPPTDVTSGWYTGGVCTIGEGEEEEVFVANANGIYRFSLASGKYLGCVTTDVSWPRGIAFTKDEKLVVAEKFCVKIFAPAEK